MKPDEYDISVIVCCYNSASRLPETIKHLVCQKIQSEFKWEILIIDNASADNTKKVAQDEFDRVSDLKADYRIIDQPEKGLAKAREKGIQESRYPIIIFCDDDNHFEPDYLEVAHNLMVKMPEVGILGGLSKPKLAYYPGSWIEDMYPAMAIGSRSTPNGYTEWVFGAGMVMRKRIFKELEKREIKFLLSDRIGNKQSWGGDSEWCQMAKFIGYEIYYSSDLILYHYMQPHRLKKSFFFKGPGAVYPAIYLWVLGVLSKNTILEDKNKLFLKLYKEKMNFLIHFLPRVFLGKHKFYSCVNIYHLITILIWLSFKRKKFDLIYSDVLNNLRIKII